MYKILLPIFVEIIIFIWLMKETILVVSSINIFEYLNNWFRDRPIILPSICFLTFPFLICFTIDSLPSFLQESNSNSSSFFTWLTTIATAIFTALGLFLNNRYSEKNKIEREKKELANILILIMKEHLKKINELKGCLNCTIITDPNIEKIDRYADSIKNDHIYQNIIYKVGIYDLITTRLMVEYYQISNIFINEFNSNFDKNSNHLSPHFADRSEYIIKDIIVNSNLLIMVFSKLFLNNKELYQKSKDLVKKEYFYFYENEETVLISNDFVVENSGHHAGTEYIKDLVNKIIYTFKELRILNELRKF